MKTLNSFINEGAGASVYVLYAAPKKGEDPKKNLFDRVTIGVYSSKKTMDYDMDQAIELVANTPGYEDYEVLYYQHNLNFPLVDM